MKTFKHENKTYTTDKGFLYEVNKGLIYTPVSKGSTLESIARENGFKRNIEDSIGDGFHNKAYRQNHYNLNGLHTGRF